MSCNFWGHKFGFWEEKRRGDIKINSKVVGFFLNQERKCLKCGYLEIDIQKVGP